MKKIVLHSSTQKPPASGRKPGLRLTEQELDASVDELMVFHQLFKTVFQRCEQREWSFFYLCGQLSNLPRKTIERMVLFLHGADCNTVRVVQRFISQGTWRTEHLIQRQQELVAEWLGDPQGVVIVDGSGFPKQGQASVGVARQYCGAVGKKANSQEGVFLAYVSDRGNSFLDARLYLHASWFTDEARSRWQRCGIPTDISFQTEPDLALAMLRSLVTHPVVPFRWVVADAHFGEVPAFLDAVSDLGKWYLIEVPCNTHMWLHTPTVEPPGRGMLGRPRTQPRVSRHAPRSRELRELAETLPRAAWTRHRIKEGSKGPIIADFAFLHVTTVRDSLPGPRVWVIFRRQVCPTPELKFYFSNAPSACSHAELIRICGLRWPVETTLEEGKDELGMDHYEVRSWAGWHHHMAQTFMAHLFVIHLGLLLKKKFGIDLRPNSSVDCSSIIQRARLTLRRVSCDCISAAEKLCCVLFASSPSTQAKAVIFTWASTERETSYSY